MLVEAYCTCGDVLKIEVPRAKRQRVLMNWSDKHSGAGHHPADAASAEMARMGSGQRDGREARKGSEGHGR